MITRKHLFFAVAATCLLTTFLFGVVPIRSAGYDPSLDENHDGKIDGKDIALPALIYGTAGDPTVPVNVTNWPTGLTSGNVNVTIWPQTFSLQTGICNISSTGANFIPIINCSGYSRLSITIGGITNASLGAGNNITISPYFIAWLYQPSGCSALELLPDDLNITVNNGYDSWSGAYLPFMIETKAPYCYVNWIYTMHAGGVLPLNWWVTWEYAVYLRNE